jgi:serine/threonine protein kinase
MSFETRKPAKMPLLAGMPQHIDDTLVGNEPGQVIHLQKPVSAWDIQLKKIGPYQIIKVLGFGGVGTVFEAFDESINRKVALKVLNRKWLKDEIVKERFIQEASLNARIKSLHVATVHAVGVDDGVPYLAMELLTGMSLEELVNKNKLTVLQIIRIAREVAKGLQAAHLQHLIHRDIKPANIWLDTLPDPEGGGKIYYRVKILDFGLARLLDQKDVSTRHGMVVGTPAYMSPEQTIGRKVDPRSDLFSLGVVLYHLFTGNLPFNGENDLAIMTAICQETPPPVHKINPQVPAKLSRLIERLMSKSPDQRPLDASILNKQLKIIEQLMERRVKKKMPKTGTHTALQTAASSIPAANQRSEDTQLPKKLLLAILVINLFMLVGMAVIIFELLTRK